MLYRLNEKLELKGVIYSLKRRNRNYDVFSADFKQRREFLSSVCLYIGNKNNILNLLGLINSFGSLFLTKRRSQYLLFESVFKRYHAKPRISLIERARNYLKKLRI